MRTPVQARSESSADRMLAATLDLLAAGGLGAVTVAAVAKAAGASNGSLYHRFGDRTGLLLAAQDVALGEIESATAAAFARADAEPDDDRALGLLAAAALDIFAEHRGAMRAYLVEGRNQSAFEARNVRCSHLLAGTVVGWLRSRFGTDPADAEAAYRILFALGAAQALFDDEQVSPGQLPRAAFADAVARAVGALAR
ncbi:TetR family transcriptional regulator [Nocardioides sp. W7]|uniref:TetR family transcriptional regulator n=1 Tax=Nocardioides sp. W7 TaxID=2931390 RepID=UPI001FD23560|nr:TetR family transcriptional regulator [Nocardioides sp. W7]